MILWYPLLYLLYALAHLCRLLGWRERRGA
jgi:hypothetical protein